MSLQSSYLTTTTSSVYSSSGSTAALTFYFANYSTTANATFSLWAVSSGSTPSNVNVLYSNVVVAAGDTYVADTERLFLNNGDELYARANANSAISMTLTYTTV
jgi:hypothetical protein